MSAIIHVTDNNRADNRFQDGALPHVQGVKSFQIVRANRSHPEDTDAPGWTYNHAAMLAYAYDRFFCEYLSNPVDEHETPGRTLLTQSPDGVNWSKPVIAFPIIDVPTAQYKGPRSAMLTETIQTVPHQRMGFYHASNGMLLLLSFYGIVHDRAKSSPCDGWGVGRVVRQIRPDGALGEHIYFLIYNEPAGYTAKNTPIFAPYQTCGDKAFVAACDELLQNGAVVRQMYEEQRFDQKLFPVPGAQALSFYTTGAKQMVGVYKKSLVSVSEDGGATWTAPAFQPSIHTGSGKVWAQKTSDGRYTLMYNPTTDGQHRWPIAAVTGTDGYHFDHMAAITDDMSPQRYGGRDKNLGPQYMRGIAECNPQAPDGDVWLVYSNNKEDIWISRIPVPLVTQGAPGGELIVKCGEFPADWGVYSPKWAPVTADNGMLTLRDRDPYDMARVEKALPECNAGQLSLTLRIDKVAPEGAVTFEVQDARGQTPIRLVFKPDGMLYVRSDGRLEPWISYAPGADFSFTLTLSPDTNRFALEAGSETRTFSYCASVNTLSRFRLMTKTRIPALCTLEDNGKYGTSDRVLPHCEEPTQETCVRLRAARWNVQLV